jgi:hypothetical protein
MELVASRPSSDSEEVGSSQPPHRLEAPPPRRIAVQRASRTNQDMLGTVSTISQTGLAGWAEYWWENSARIQIRASGDEISQSGADEDQHTQGGSDSVDRGAVARHRRQRDKARLRAEK